MKFWDVTDHTCGDPWCEVVRPKNEKAKYKIEQIIAVKKLTPLPWRRQIQKQNCKILSSRSQLWRNFHPRCELIRPQMRKNRVQTRADHSCEIFPIPCVKSTDPSAKIQNTIQSSSRCEDTIQKLLSTIQSISQLCKNFHPRSEVVRPKCEKAEYKPELITSVTFFPPRVWSRHA